MREGRFQLGLEIAAGNVGNLNFPHSLLCVFINYLVLKDIGALKVIICKSRS